MVEHTKQLKAQNTSGSSHVVPDWVDKLSALIEDAKAQKGGKRVSDLQSTREDAKAQFKSEARSKATSVVVRASLVSEIEDEGADVGASDDGGDGEDGDDGSEPASSRGDAKKRSSPTQNAIKRKAKGKQDSPRKRRLGNTQDETPLMAALSDYLASLAQGQLVKFEQESVKFEQEKELIRMKIELAQLQKGKEI